MMVLCYLRHSEREYNGLIRYWSISISWTSITPDKGLIFFNDLNHILSRNLDRVKNSTVVWKTLGSGGDPREFGGDRSDLGVKAFIKCRAGCFVGNAHFPVFSKCLSQKSIHPEVPEQQNSPIK